MQPSAAVAAVPSLRLIVVSELDGMLEPCGCTRDGRGGVDRLVTAIDAARAEAEHAGVPSVVIAAGDMLFRGAGEIRQQDTWGAELLADVLGRLHVDVLAPGSRDLGHPAQLAAITPAVWLGEALWNPLAPATPALWSRSALIRRGDVISGFVTADAADLEGASALAALQRDVTALRERAALVVAIVRSARDEPVRVNAEATAADVVVQVGADAAPTLTSPSTLLLAPGRRGEQLLIADLWLGSGATHEWRSFSERTLPDASLSTRAVRVRRLDLDSQIPSDPDTRSALDTLFARQNSYNQKHADAPAPSLLRSEMYAGSDTCAACHTRAYFWWQTSRHARAFETLVKRGRQFDRDCIGCHVTGYDRPGGATLADVEHVRGVGCESCHGPGDDHANNPQSPSVSVRRAVPAEVCLGCHDAEHHAAFRYESARPALLTRAHGRPL